MAAINKTSLSLDESERVRGIHEEWDNSGKIALNKLFRFNSITHSLSCEKVSLSGYDAQQALTAFPFHERIFIQFCPRCDFDRKVLTPLLETGHVVPILIAGYRFYKSSILKELIRYPHISSPELFLFRKVVVGAQSNLFCDGCMTKRFDAQLLKTSLGKDHPVASIAKRFYHNLFPFPESDSDLIEEFLTALANKDIEKMFQLETMTGVVKELRLAEILKASPALEAQEFESVRKLGITMSQDKNTAPPSIEHLIAENFQISIPRSMSPEKYLGVVMSHKQKLIKIVRQISKNSQGKNGGVSLSMLTSEIGMINEQIRRAQGTRRFAALQAAAGLVSTSPFMIGSLIAAGGIGLCSSMLGCNLGTAASFAGAGAATTGIAKVIAKAAKTKWDKRVVAYKDRVLHDLRDQLSELTAAYLQMDIRAVHVWQIRQDLSNRRSRK